MLLCLFSLRFFALERCVGVLVGTFLVLTYLGQDCCYLLQKQHLELVHRVLIKVVLMAEVLRQLSCIVALVNDNPTLVVGAQVDIDEEQGRFIGLRLVLVEFRTKHLGRHNLLLLLHRLDAKTLLGTLLKVRGGFNDLRRWLVGDLRDASLMCLHKPLLLEPCLL